jgi:deoxycytidylate deaminase
MKQSAHAASDTKQLLRDHYYMKLAVAVRGRENLPGTDEDQPEGTQGYGANCYGSKIGAVLVLEDRVVSTGYNGTPSGFTNCMDGGCIRCKDSWLEKHGRKEEMTDPSHVAGAALDRCICVHAEQNALLTAARFGISVRGATLYSTLSPCFGCLKESIQAGIKRIVFEKEYQANYSPGLRRQYDELASQLDDFGSIAPEPEKTPFGGPDPFVDA